MSYGDKYVSFETLKGLTLSEVIISDGDDKDDVITFRTNDNQIFKMWHDQDCCESVHIEDINGEMKDVVGSEILLAEEIFNHEKDDDNYESATWTFYKLSTIKGSVTIRWLGRSNGYYSERVSFVDITPEIPEAAYVV
jgi:nitrate reductase beta subunit